MSLRQDVTYERATLDTLLDDPASPQIMPHALLAVMRAIREVAAQLSLVEERLQTVAAHLEPRGPALQPIGDTYLNPAYVVTISPLPNGGSVALLVSGHQAMFPETSPGELAAVLSW